MALYTRGYNNATFVLTAKKNKVVFKKGRYDDNCISMRLRIIGNDPVLILGNEKYIFDSGLQIKRRLEVSYIESYHCHH
jgi:hypothetical protein